MKKNKKFPPGVFIEMLSEPPPLVAVRVKAVLDDARYGINSTFVHDYLIDHGFDESVEVEIKRDPATNKVHISQTRFVPPGHAMCRCIVAEEETQNSAKAAPRTPKESLPRAFKTIEELRAWLMRRK